MEHFIEDYYYLMKNNNNKSNNNNNNNNNNNLLQLIQLELLSKRTCKFPIKTCSSSDTCMQKAA